jgi:hypothetical protein
MAACTLKVGRKSVLISSDVIRELQDGGLVVPLEKLGHFELASTTTAEELWKYMKLKMRDYYI